MMIDQIPENLLKLIKDGESSTVEFKAAKMNLPDSLFETVCSMLNRNGWHIFLGIKDNVEVIGVYKDYVKDMKRNFANLCKNSEKISPTVHLEIKEYMYDEKEIYTYIYNISFSPYIYSFISRWTVGLIFSLLLHKLAKFFFISLT